MVEQDNNKIDLESAGVTGIIEIVSDDEDMGGLESVEETRGDAEKITGNEKLKQVKFSYYDIAEEIAKLQKKLDDIKTCTVCTYHGSSYRSVSLHMTLSHK